MNDIIAKQVKTAEDDIIVKETLIGYLNSLKEGLDKKEKAEFDMKIEGLKRDIKFNQGYIDYVSKL